MNTGNLKGSRTYYGGLLPIHLAVREHDAKLFRILLEEFGANINGKTYAGDTLLLLAIESMPRGLDVLEVLLESGVSIRDLLEIDNAVTYVTTYRQVLRGRQGAAGHDPPHSRYISTGG